MEDYIEGKMEHSDSYDLSSPDYKTGIFPIKLQVQKNWGDDSYPLLGFIEGLAP
jgi:hypothetical protein